MGRRGKAQDKAREAEITNLVGDRIARASRRKAAPGDTVPGPSPNPATNLLIGDLALRGVGRLVRLSLEKGLLGRRYGREFARDAIDNRSLLHTAAAYSATKLATRSIPGAALVWGGLLVKVLYDRRKGKRAARRAGDRQLARQAEPDKLA